MLAILHSLSRFAEGFVVSPVPLLVLRRAVQHHAAAGAPLEASPWFCLVEALDAHGKRPHFVLKLGLIHPCFGSLSICETGGVFWENRAPAVTM